MLFFLNLLSLYLRKYRCSAMTRKPFNIESKNISARKTQKNEQPSKTLKDITDFDIQCATLLAQAVIINNKYTKIPSVKTWARAFRDLRKISKIEESRIKKVLLWYIENINHSRAPAAWCGKTFRDKFLRIEMCMEISEKKCHSIAISENARKIVTRISHLHWPSAVANDLPKFVQASINNHKEFTQKLNKYLKTKQSRIAELLRDSAPRDTIIEQWWLKLYPLFKKYPNTDMSNYIWCATHKIVIAQYDKIIMEYCAKPNMAKTLIMEIMK